MSGYFISQGGVRNQHYIDDTRESNDDLWRRNFPMKQTVTSCEFCGKVIRVVRDDREDDIHEVCEECKKIGADADTYSGPSEPDFDELSSIEKLERLAKYRRQKGD